MKDLLFRLKVSLVLLWVNGCAYMDPRTRPFVWGWLRNGMRDLWTKELSDYYCCWGFGCGCYGRKWRKHWNDLIEYHLRG